MPTWSSAIVTIQGNMDGMNEFVKRFIYPRNKAIVLPDHKYFARAFINDYTRESVLQDITDLFSQQEENDVDELVLFDVKFAHSATCCTLDGYPEVWPNKCISLDDACIEDDVSVWIDAVNYERNTEEIITCDSNGELVSSGVCPMPQYVCTQCGNIESIPSSILDTDDVDMGCSECGSELMQRINEQ